MSTANSFSKKAFIEFLRRMHAVVGLVIGPFIVIASITGALYGITFATEKWFYKDILFTKSRISPKKLSEQIATANGLVKDDGELLAVRPAANSEETTRVLYSAENLGDYEYRTIFIDPNNLEIKGDLVTYGSGGAMPLRKTMDLLHRDLLLGQWGRWYSELAASWLWIMGFTGLTLYLKRLKTNLFKSKNPYQKIVSFHSYLGLFCFIGLIMLSVTGLTWSHWAGDNISRIRAAFNWVTPSVQRELPAIKNNSFDLSMFDKIQNLARDNGIDAKRIEIKPGKRYQEAWLVSEIERTLPTKVDSIAIDPQTLRITDRAAFQDFPFMAKMTRWAIDLHTGSLFGLLNQALLIILSTAISVLAISGYVMWLKRRGWRIALPNSKSLWWEYRHQPLGNALIISFGVILIGAMLPAFLVSLLAFTLIEELIYITMFYQVERS